MEAVKIIGFFTEHGIEAERKDIDHKRWLMSSWAMDEQAADFEIKTHDRFSLAECGGDWVFVVYRSRELLFEPIDAAVLRHFIPELRSIIEPCLPRNMHFDDLWFVLGSNTMPASQFLHAE